MCSRLSLKSSDSSDVPPVGRFKTHNFASNCEERERERENQQDATIGCLLSQHVSGIIMSFFRRTKTVCYCIWCTALVLLDVDGSGCGALRCRLRAV